VPDEAIREKAMEDLREGKSASTAAGEFVKAEIDKVRGGEHGVRSAKQAIAIGLSEARRAGVPLKAPNKERNSPQVMKQAARDTAKGKSGGGMHPDPKRSRASKKALEKEPNNTVSRKAMSRQATGAAQKRTDAERHASAMKAVKTKGDKGLKAAGEKAAKTRKDA
jgi:Family of unknown function (DUF6496)